MADDQIDDALLTALYRFAWALSGDEAGAAALTQRVIAENVGRLTHLGSSRLREVSLFSAAYQLFTGGVPLLVPLAHDRISLIGKLSHQHAEALNSESLLKSFRELELPQRAALVLFYTTQCSLHDIAAVLQRSSDETVAILSRGKAEWLHILERTGGDRPEKEAR